MTAGQTTQRAAKTSRLVVDDSFGKSTGLGEWEEVDATVWDDGLDDVSANLTAEEKKKLRRAQREAHEADAKTKAKTQQQPARKLGVKANHD